MLASKGAVNPSPLSPVLAAVSPLVRAWTTYRNERTAQAELRRGIAELRELDDAALADIGANRIDIPVIAAGKLRRS